MKICYLTNNAIPSTTASSLQITKMCEEFSKNKNNVLLICPATKITNESIFDYYAVKNKFKVKKLEKFKQFPLGIKYYMFSFLSILESLKFNADIYITRNFFTSFILSILRKKNILELHHEIDIESRIVQLISKYSNFFNYNSLIKIVAITESVKLYYKKKFKINEEKFLVSPSGSSLKINKFYFSNNKKKLNIGYFGSIYKSRGIELILKLSRIDKNNNYYIYGDFKKFKNIKIKNSNSNLFIGGYIPYKRIPEKIVKMDILLMPYSSYATSAGDIGNIIKYTSPLKLFDYLASGKFIICSNISVLKEIISEKKNAVLINNSQNVFSWKMEIDKIKNLIDKRLIFSMNNFKLSNEYLLKKRVKQILENV
tara:strand:+ start:2989 stop:4098 length:1110 start_codon:yes stop_codon:yes gene_type:complete